MRTAAMLASDQAPAPRDLSTNQLGTTSRIEPFQHFVQTYSIADVVAKSKEYLATNRKP